ncbi:A/G-specific adenine glycosylase [Candidatus Poriferisocius sp.]|uniref:A/G-specific adenine glycosylase n=1 Tax=Candidatus Poriferisocius sp. TaxID=3101276 RepID=UPI003B5C8D9F
MSHARPAESREAALLAWGERNRRDLPWRRTRDPWAVLVSEVMLQQTQISRVVPRYRTFLEEFPTAAACAAAPPAAVIRAWDGLGYNRRAVSLHRCAQLVVAGHGGRPPDGLAALLALPGVGPYTARAVLAFAYEHDVGVVDTNVGRVLARWQGRPLTAAEAQAAADAAVPPGGGWAWNQALFDLAAEVCTRRAPRCEQCPVRWWCRWRGRGADPADGSAGVSGGQSRFAGSDRQGRGRLVAALRMGPVAGAEVAAACGWPDDPTRAERILGELVAEGMVEIDREGRARLPEAESAHGSR